MPVPSTSIGVEKGDWVCAAAPTMRKKKEDKKRICNLLWDLLKITDREKSTKRDNYLTQSKTSHGNGPMKLLINTPVSIT